MRQKESKSTAIAAVIISLATERGFDLMGYTNPSIAIALWGVAAFASWFYLNELKWMQSIRSIRSIHLGGYMPDSCGFCMAFRYGLQTSAHRSRGKGEQVHTNNEGNPSR